MEGAHTLIGTSTPRHPTYWVRDGWKQPVTKFLTVSDLKPLWVWFSLSFLGWAEVLLLADPLPRPLGPYLIHIYIPGDPLLLCAWRKHRPSANGPAFSASALTTLSYLIYCGQNAERGPSLITPKLRVSFLNFQLGKPVSDRSPLMVVVLILLHRQRTPHNGAEKGFSEINIFNNIWNIYSIESLSYVNLYG